MIKFLSNWIQGIAVAVILTSIFEMILPNSNLKKYVKIVLGMYVVFSIISPFAKAKDIYSTTVSEKMEQIEENVGNMKYKEYSSEKNLDKIYKSTFEKEIIKTVENEGFKVYKCSIEGNFDAENDNAGINKIDIVLYSEKEHKKVLVEENEILNTKSDFCIENVNEIKNVEISIGKETKSENNNKVEAKDIDTLRKFLSKHYEIEKNAIEIRIR